jgi:hypothetical protein
MNTSHPLLANDPNRNFYSVGYACQVLQVLPTQLMVLMQAVGVEVDMTIDGVVYLSGDQMQKVVDECTRVRAEIENAQEFAQNAPNN